MANLNGSLDWVGMAPCIGLMSPVRAYSLWVGLCPEKLVKLKNWMKFKGLQLQDTLIHSRIPSPSLSKQNLLGVLSEGNVLMHDFVIRANFTNTPSLKEKFFAFALVVC